MSQTKPDHENNKMGNIYTPYSRRNFPKNRNRNVYNHPYNNYHYSRKYNFQPHWGYWRKRPPHGYRNKTPEKQRQRSPSPFSGTEEYTLKKIQETSDMIKKRLMMPETEDIVNTPTLPVNDEVENENEETSSKTDSEKTSAKTNKKVAQYNVEEIHDKIITHITNLSHGKKMNLICANSSGYDVAIHQIHKQKRLELSKVLRDMCSNQTVENSEAINSIIPDIGIKIEDLPLEVIQELSSTLDLNFDDDDSFIQNSEATVSIKNEICESNNVSLAPVPESLEQESSDGICLDKIKQEVLDIPDIEVKNEVCDGAGDFPMGTSNFDFVPHNDNSDSGDNFKMAKVDIKEELYVNSNCISENVGMDFNPTASVGSQTDATDLSSVCTQTDSNNCQFRIDKESINTLDDAITAMLNIDNEIMRLTELRQSIFTKLQNKQETKSPSKNTKRSSIAKVREISGKKAKKDNKTKSSPDKTNSPEKQNGDFDVLIREKDVYYENILNFAPVAEKILVIRVIEDTILAASENGNIFYINTSDGTTAHTLHVSPAPITSLCHWTTPKKKQLHFFVGSSDGRLSEFNFETRQAIRLNNLHNGIQCMEMAWCCVFVGTSNGKLIRYSLQQSKIEFEETISNESVMVLKATQEGARRVLLVGARDEPVCVRDAMSGLYLRTMTQLVTPTVYTLVLENSMVYCGTKFHDILVFSFHDGQLVHKHEATNSKGISCMKVVDNLLFASCYNGNIYVFNVKTHRYIGIIEGPGGVILSIEIVKNLVIVGTMSLNFKSILIPDHMLEHNKI